MTRCRYRRKQGEDQNSKKVHVEFQNLIDDSQARTVFDFADIDAFFCILFYP